MTLSAAAQATLLLAGYFAAPAKGAAKPLTPTEWGLFAQWLHEQGHTPAGLLGQERHEILLRWQHAKVTKERLEALLQRGNSMALAVEKWQRSGLWIITRSDSAYPRALKKRLKQTAPPILYGCGNAELLDAGGVAVVGSRKASGPDLAYAYELGAMAAQAGMGTVSGGAKGIDEAAMRGAVEQGGPVIGVLSEGLLRAATSRQWREGLLSGGLVLISPYYPEARFNTGNAMGRNKYIYCLADAAVVVHSGTRGGTKAGAEENLKKGWVPLWVKPTQDPEAGNRVLVEAGGAWCKEDVARLEVRSLIGGGGVLGSDVQQDCEIDASGSLETPGGVGVEDSEEAILSLSGESQLGLAFDDAATTQEMDEATQSAAPETAMAETTTKTDREEPLADSSIESDEAAFHSEQVDFYQLFLRELQRGGPKPKTADEISAETGLHKTQVNAWLKRAAEDGLVVKLARPVRYQVIQG
ncbi:DNA-processing protein DprA [Thioalkalivibrio sp. ALE11]|uniref:DNA-processing protein DprA n=1 Tax=Thioalkalivibrio sp. ALE11 TaxID=1265494 RepID=UPI000376B2B3|nr:DNA-processing protein DprA [Thioalkalivibrio sp. ALE11]